MSKRKEKENVSEKCQHVNTKVRKMHWSLGLLESMKDPDTIYKETEHIVVIRDKYPKAKIHYLMMPKDNIKDIYHLKREHISLLEEFGKLYTIIKEEHIQYELNAGFHAIPSMQRLHMHIISKDMVSPCLKTKVHWNSFTTEAFKPYESKFTSIDIVITAFISRVKIIHNTYEDKMPSPYKINNIVLK